MNSKIPHIFEDTSAEYIAINDIDDVFTRNIDVTDEEFNQEKEKLSDKIENFRSKLTEIRNMKINKKTSDLADLHIKSLHRLFTSPNTIVEYKDGEQVKQTVKDSSKKLINQKIDNELKKNINSSYYNIDIYVSYGFSRSGFRTNNSKNKYISTDPLTRSECEIIKNKLNQHIESNSDVYEIYKTLPNAFCNYGDKIRIRYKI